MHDPHLNTLALGMDLTGRGADDERYSKGMTSALPNVDKVSTNMHTLAGGWEPGVSLDLFQGGGARGATKL